MYSFDANKVKNELIEFVKDWFAQNGNSQTKAILGISGGKDSTVCSKILSEALGKERVIGVLMPNGTQADIDDSFKVVSELGIKYYNVNIANAYKGLTDELKKVLLDDNVLQTDDDLAICGAYKTNTPARLRMTTLYGLGAIIGDCRVVNTSNLSEAMLGWGTYGGDVFGDVSLLGKLTTDEVVAVGDALGMPYNLVHKTPSDGMCGCSDEEKLGFTYSEANNIIRNNVKGEHYEEIVRRARNSKFKRHNINLPKYDPQLVNYLENI